MYINITDSEIGNNKGSSTALVTYLEKENRLPEKEQKPEHWFNGRDNAITPQQVRVTIDNNIAKLGRNDAKFYLINISPSQKEIGWLKQNYGEQGMAEQLKAFALKVMDGYATNFKRPGIENNNSLLWYGKLENFRYYGHNDLEVKQGQRQRGERKDGEQMHIQIIVSRKDITNTVKLSPMNNSRGRNAEHSAKLGQFDRRAFKQSGETLFDQMFSFDRALKDTMEYALTMKNGNAKEKQQLYAREQQEQSLNYEFDSHKERSLLELLNPGSLLPDGGQVQYNNPDDLIPDPKKKKRGYRR
ncbi:DUF5712 family protein [Flavobacterium beibuense]|uniref:Mobilization protein B n=1 Tax=Flavobacterium beibuense TaxID=657326 RepID=A0A444W829_9FLAO|nr:DUF5712 family protein [Flavobacterium beibuense]RYJ42055.1 Mobilization protein B [Flavobacterium beibuense]